MMINKEYLKENKDKIFESLLIILIFIFLALGIYVVFSTKKEVPNMNDRIFINEVDTRFNTTDKRLY